MIRKEARYDAYAYRVSAPLSKKVEKLEEGQFVSYGDDNELVIADGTKKSFLAIGSHRPGRDLVGGKPIREVAILVGNFIVTLDTVDVEQTYKVGDPLKVKEGGILTKAADEDAGKIVAYAMSELEDGFLRVASK